MNIDEMTVEECIQGIEKLDICCNRAEIVREKVTQLLEKHIPKKVKPVTRTIHKYKCCICSYKGGECEHLKEMDGHLEYTDYVCPTCGAIVADNGMPKYCWRCGQEFVWEQGGFIPDESSISEHKA